MASTFSTNLAIELIGTGDQAGTWGTTTNSNLGTLIEQAISGYVTQAVATGTDTTITIPNGSTGVARNMYIELTGTGGASTNLIVPSNKKLYFIFNNSTGAVTVKVSGQTGVSVPTGKKMVLVSNGTDIVNGLNYIADFGTNSFSVTNLTASSGTITNLIATSGSITNLVSSDASATVLRAGSATLTHLSATSATITNLTLTSLVISNLSIASANITTLTSASATITNLLATSLAVSGIATFSAGSAAAPSITTTGDTNTGIFFPAADTIAFTEGGTESFRVNSSGNMGIGTTTPAGKLDVNGNGAFSGTLTATLPSSVGAIVARNSSTTASELAVRPASGKSGWLSFTEETVADRWIVGITNGNGGLFFNTGNPSSNTNRMVLDSSGNLGIGTATIGSRVTISDPGTGLAFSNAASGNFNIGLLAGTGSALAYVYQRANSDLLFGTNNAEVGRFTAAGNLGIGTASPTNYGATYKTLAVNGSSTGIVDVMQNGTVYGQLSTEANVYKVEAVGASTVLRFVTNSATRATLDTSGNLGLGVTPSAWGGGYNALQIGASGSLAFTGSGTNDFTMAVNAVYDSTDSRWEYRYTGDASARYSINALGQHIWYNAASGTAGNAISFTQAMTLDASGNLALGGTSNKVTGLAGGGTGFTVQATAAPTIGVWDTSDASYYLQLSQIDANSYLWNIANGFLSFGTNNTERARIDSSGRMIINGTTQLYTSTLTLYRTGNSYNLTSTVTGTGSEGHVVFENGNGAVGTIFTNASATSYNTSSDRRLKNNIAPADSAGSVIDAIEVVKHDWKAGGHTRYGMIAQDLHMVAPEAVSVGDADDVEDFKNPWGVDYSKLVPMLVKELQSLRKRVAELESK